MISLATGSAHAAVHTEKSLPRSRYSVFVAAASITESRSELILSHLTGANVCANVCELERSSLHTRRHKCGSLLCGISALCAHPICMHAIIPLALFHTTADSGVAGN
eukprot:jgi/Ulvmu1/8492/UM044_0026.1